MSTPLTEYPYQPPPFQMAQQAYNPTRPPHGSVGPVIGVLAVITLLGAIAVMIGRLCSGRKIMGYGQYDFEGWVEAKCGSCIDGRVDPVVPRVVVEHRVVNNPVVEEREGVEEEEEEEEEDQPQADENHREEQRAQP